LDRYYSGVTERISNESPVPVVNITKKHDLAGGAANVALNIANLGGKVGLCGFVGQDEAAKVLTTITKEASVTTIFVQTKYTPTITKLRVLSQNKDSISNNNEMLQQMIRLDIEEEQSDSDGDRLVTEVKGIIDQYNTVIISLSDCSKGVIKQCKTIISIANSKNIPVLVDPKFEDFSIFEGAKILKPNYNELQVVVGKINSEEMLVEKATALIEMYNLEALLVTRDKLGMTLIQSNGKVTTIPTAAKKVIDVNGAGDTVIAVMAMSVSCGFDMITSINLANSAAGIVVGKKGAAAVTIQELSFYLSNKNNDNQRILTLHELKALVVEARLRNEKIVLTNGCFDLLHCGHVECLKKARALGDRLIVAVNTDESVKRLKGEGRPSMDVKCRTTVLAALECVDWVVSFNEDTPIDIIKTILPDVLVKGDEYSVESIIGGKEVIAAGGQVVTITTGRYYSSTEIRAKIKNSAQH